jgi:hypothetical protein
MLKLLRLFAPLVLVTVSLFSSFGMAQAAPPLPQAAWTVMVYSCW